MADKKEKNTDPEDDGRTIAKMNVDGMPWYVGGGAAEPGVANETGAANKPGADKQVAEQLVLTGKEKRAMLRGVLSASLLVGGIYIVCLTLFILFCVFVWLR